MKNEQEKTRFSCPAIVKTVLSRNYESTLMTNGNIKDCLSFEIPNIFQQPMMLYKYLKKVQRKYISQYFLQGIISTLVQYRDFPVFLQ